MGSVHTKATNQKTPTPLTDSLTTGEYTAIFSPVYRADGGHDDPRSPGCARTPVSTPPPPLHRTRELMRGGSASKLDPRSPSVKRTPLHHVTNDDVALQKPAPSPFNLADPRSPFVARTPLSLSANDAVFASHETSHAKTETVPFEDQNGEAEVSVKTEGKNAMQADGASFADTSFDDTSSATVSAESTSQKLTTENFTPDLQQHSAVSKTFVRSPVLSPYGRKRKDIAHVSALSPLKKSFSAPLSNENHPPSSPLLLVNSKNAAAATKTVVSKTGVSSKLRTPLSPLSQRAMNQRHCVQPIKFRMDPGILG